MDWLIAALVYVPCWITGKLIADHFGLDQFLMGWIAGGVGYALRVEGPMCLRPDYMKHRS